MTKKTAIPHKHDADMVLTSDRGSMSRSKALQLGYDVDGFAQGAGGKGNALCSWRLAIECLPEARERAAATAELLASRNPENLTVGQARAFLRGLPVETQALESTETMTTNEDPRAARLAEIANSMTAFNKNRGYASKARTKPALSTIEPAKLKRLTEIRISALYFQGQGMNQEAKTLRLALDTHDKVGSSLASALTQLGVDASKLLPSI